MKDYYDFSKGFRDPERVKRLRERGCKITVTRGEGDEKVIVEEYFVTPEELQADAERRKSRRVQNS